MGFPSVVPYGRSLVGAKKLTKNRGGVGKHRPKNKRDRKCGQ